MVGIPQKSNLPDRLIATLSLRLPHCGLWQNRPFLRRFRGELEEALQGRPTPDRFIARADRRGVWVRIEWRGMQPKVVEPKKDGTPREQAEWRKEHLNPVWYRREYRAQFSDSAFVYFDPERVKLCFDPGLVEQSRFTPGREYRMHCDPGRVNDYFSIMVAHAEDGKLVEDKAVVLRPEDAPNHTLDYKKVESLLISLLLAFRPASVTFDQYNSAYLIDSLQAAAGKNNIACEVGEETATRAKNQDMFENLKLLINQGKVRCYRDSLNVMEKDRCLLEASLDKVEDVQGKIVKPREQGYGHLDLVDCLAVLALQFSDSLSDGGDPEWQEGMTDMGVAEW